ncbi:MAG: twin-arginine translocation signal domain-containing protein, partial [Betaproteobacteria bacterium]
MKPEHSHTVISRRQLLGALGAGALAAGAPVRAQGAYPSRQIRVIVPYGPGGGTDILIRMIAPAVGATLGQP